jgi:hypothetical protein
VLAGVGGCTFGVPGLGETDASQPPPDLSQVAVDSAAPPVPPDLAIPDAAPADPCAAPLPVANTIGAACVIGNPPTLDGNLSDWPTALFSNTLSYATAAEHIGSWASLPADNDLNSSAVFALRWDQTYLYLAVRVSDQSRSSVQVYYYDGDSVEIYLDGLHDRSIAYGADDAELIVVPGGNSQLWRYRATGNPQMSPTTFIAKTMDSLGAGGALTNWNLEAAIPWSFLGGGAVSAGRLVGFDLALNDNDGSAMRERSMVWKNAAAPACRCDMTNNMCSAYCSPQSFFGVQLGGR